jgi:hypothetical protein
VIAHAPLQLEWTKMGRIFRPSGEGTLRTHATRPIPYRLKDGRLRLFFSSRTGEDMPLPTFIDVDAGDPSQVLSAELAPMMQLGRPGTFDDSGITPVSILRHGGEDRMYYVGWKRRRYGVTIEASIGLAILTEDGNRLERAFEGPILGQDINHPLMTAAPFVVHDEGRYRMWYCSGSEWKNAGLANPEPIYTVCYAESDDGISWRADGRPVIPYAYDGEVISAPWILKIRGSYHMWYSTRGYETKDAKNYTIGYAHSRDGRTWERDDALAGIRRSATGWDSEMVCYPAFYGAEDRVYMFYCGNGVGRDGIGYAVAPRFLD